MPAITSSSANSSSGPRSQPFGFGVRRKLVVVGDGACGKTSLLITFSKGHFPEVKIIFIQSIILYFCCLDLCPDCL
jgi:GTPase SAR1 family protein